MKEHLITTYVADQAYECGFRNYVCLLDKWLKISSKRCRQSLLQYWLRYEYNIDICISVDRNGRYFIGIYEKDIKNLTVNINGIQPNLGETYSSYELALEVALRLALRYLKKKLNKTNN